MLHDGKTTVASVYDVLTAIEGTFEVYEVVLEVDYVEGRFVGHGCLHLL